VLEAQQRIADIQADRQRQAEENQLSVIFRTPINGKVAIDNQASRSIIRSWLDETQGDTAISVQWFLKLLKEIPSLAQSLSWQSADVLDPAKRRQAEAAQDAEERHVFHDFCRENGFSEAQANFSLVKSVLGSFDQYALVQAVQSNALEGLAPASSEELEQFSKEAIEKQNAYLRSLDIPTLRKMAREAGARIAAGPPPALDETQRVRAAGERVNGYKYPVLPDEFKVGDKYETLDAAFIKACSREIYRQLLDRYGPDQITEAVRTRRSDASPLW
jgi:hypothetical protein